MKSPRMALPARLVRYARGLATLPLVQRCFHWLITASRRFSGTGPMISRAFTRSSGLRRSRASNQFTPALSRGCTELLDTDLSVFVYVLAEFGIRTEGELSGFRLSSESEISDNSANQGTLALSSESEISQKSQRSALVRNPNSYSTYTNTHHDVCKSSVPRAEPDAMARWLIGLERLPSEQKLKAVSAMQRVPTELRPAVIEQWLHRCDAGGVRNPLGYLLSCVQRAIRGEFNIDWRPETSPPPAGPTPSAVAAAGPPVHPPTRSGTATAAAAAAAAARTPDTVRTAREQLNAMQHLLRPRLVGTSQT